ncbi:MAG: Gfo/Idh/MocA family oxidoreductase [Planctomycetes bacterium]|nr:Gfo/Idh/MocA family oxidoreductase [Planctomycetota bacterium]
MPGQTTRRTFLKQLAAAGALLPVAGSEAFFTAAPPRKLRHAAIGVGGMGLSDLRSISAHPDVELVALCDVDVRRLVKAAIEPELARRFPGARTYRDWRELLAREGDRIDSVNIAVPDHMHAPIAMTALRMGKHVFLEKPLAHDVLECRRLAEEAGRRPDQVTQFGIQIHAHIAYRMGVEMVRTGMVGKIVEVHSWCGKGWTGPPARRPDRADPVPGHLEWDLWLGTAPARPFVDGLYHPSEWRRWVDFGTGTLGDMACHILDPVFTALDLGAPIRVTSQGAPPFEEAWPARNEIVYEFTGTRFTAGPTVACTWYDSGAWPDTKGFELAEGQKLPDAGSVFVGEEGCLLLPHWAAPRPLPAARFEGAVREFKRQFTFPPIDHYYQFVNACLGRGETHTPFGYAGSLTEAILLGLVANRYPGEALCWAAPRLGFVGRPEADRHLRRTYRAGWEVAGLSDGRTA